MNKHDVIGRVSELTGLETETCRTVIEAMDQLPGASVMGRLKGKRVAETEGAAEQLAAQTGVAQEDCRRILEAFDQTFDEGVAHTFRWFRRG